MIVGEIVGFMGVAESAIERRQVHEAVCLHLSSSSRLLLVATAHVANSGDNTQVYVDGRQQGRYRM